MFLEKYVQALKVLARKPIMLWGLSLLSGLIVFLGYIVSMPFMFLGLCVSILLNCGMALVYLDGLKGKPVYSKQLFGAFNTSAPRVVGGVLWQNLWGFIWYLVPIVGPIIAIVKSYSYSFVPYILMTRPDVAAVDAIKLSMKMTNGKKLQMWLADICISAGFVVAILVLSFLSLIPFIGLLFRLVLIVLVIAFALFFPIFTGLYKAAFFDDSINAPKAE